MNRTLWTCIICLACLVPLPVFAQTAAQRAACGADVRKFCQGIKPGGGRLFACLAKQKDQLSDACKKMVEGQGL